GRRDLHDGAAVIFDRRARSLSDGELRIYSIKVLVHHELNTNSCRVNLLRRFSKKDEIAIKLQPSPLHEQQGHQDGRQLVLVVGSATTPNITIFDDGLERIHRPLFALDWNDIGMRQHQQGAPRPVSLQPRDEVWAVRIERESLGRNPLLVEHGPEVLDYFSFVAWRVARIDLNQVPEISQDV